MKRNGEGREREENSEENQNKQERGLIWNENQAPLLGWKRYA
jgi:hypothetical protein